MKCPNCETKIAFTAELLGEQIFTLNLRWQGELMQAKTISGVIDQTRKMLEATAKDMGGKAHVFIHSIDQHDKEINVNFLVTTEKAKS